MKRIGIRLVLLVLVFGYSFSARAGWKWVDANAKLVAKSSKSLQRQIIKSYSSHRGDTVLVKDATGEAVLNYQLELSEAMSELLYMAYNSPDQKRFLKRVSQNAPKRFVSEMQRILKRIERSQWMDKPYIYDLILEEAERIAAKSIQKSKKIALKRVRSKKVVASN